MTRPRPSSPGPASRGPGKHVRSVAPGELPKPSTDSFENWTDADYDDFLFPHKRRNQRVLDLEIDCQPDASQFYPGHANALDPSLLRRPTQFEQEHNTVVAGNVAKQYQLTVKDYNIDVRDNRIRAKDERITELESDAEMTRIQLEAADKCKTAINAYVEDLGSLTETQANRIKDLIIEVNREQSNSSAKDERIRQLQIELAEEKAELTTLRLMMLRRWPYRVLGKMYVRKASGSSKTKPFPFMRLPGEVRNIVYKFCLVADDPIDFWPMLPPDAPTYATREEVVDKNLESVNVALLRTSQRVYWETICILYGCNRFRFSDERAWTVLEGFLIGLNHNCQFLTNVEIECPDWWYSLYAYHEPGWELDLATVQPILDRFSVVAESPTGPSVKTINAYARVRKMLLKLPELQEFTITLPFNAKLGVHGISQIGQLMSDQDAMLDTQNGSEQKPLSKPQRNIVFLRRPDYHNKFIMGANLDNDDAMGRNAMIKAAGRKGINVKWARYGTYEERTSYIIEDEEYEEVYDVDVPEYVEGPVRHFLGKARRLFGRK